MGNRVDGERVRIVGSGRGIARGRGEAPRIRATPDDAPLVFVEAAPDPLSLAGTQGPGPACLQDGAAGAHGLGGVLPQAAVGRDFSIGSKEEIGIGEIQMPVHRIGSGLGIAEHIGDNVNVRRCPGYLRGQGLLDMQTNRLA